MVILHPQHVPKFCTRKASISAIVIVYLVSGAVSFHKVFNGHLSFVTLQQTDALAKLSYENEGKKVFTGFNIFIIIALAMIVFVLFTFLTRKTNCSLMKSIAFLESMENERCKKRSAAYAKIIKLNVFLLVITLFSLTLTLSETLLSHLIVFISNDFKLEITSTFFKARIMSKTLIILSSFGIFITPLVFLKHIPSIGKSWWVVVKFLLGLVGFGGDN